MTDKVPFLSSCFPNIERSEIIKIVRANPSKSVDQITTLLLTRKRKVSPSIQESRRYEPPNKKRKQNVIVIDDEEEDIQIIQKPTVKPNKRTNESSRSGNNNSNIRKVIAPPSTRNIRKRTERSKFLESVHSRRLLEMSQNPPSFDSRKYENLEYQKEKFRSNKLQFESEVHAHKRKHAKKWRNMQPGKSNTSNPSQNQSNQNSRNFMTLSTLPNSFDNLPTYPKLDSSSRKYGDLSSLREFDEDPKRIGVDALKFTNEYRKKKGLSELKWNEELHTIGMAHSKNMGEKKVPFGHDGFNQRVQEMSRKIGSVTGAENVAWTSDPTQVAKKTVNGWIGSPGHRKNMESNQKICSISVYKTGDGRFYLTQLFCR